MQKTVLQAEEETIDANVADTDIVIPTALRHMTPRDWSYLRTLWGLSDQEIFVCLRDQTCYNMLYLPTTASNRYTIHNICMSLPLYYKWGEIKDMYKQQNKQYWEYICFFISHYTHTLSRSFNDKFISTIF